MTMAEPDTIDPVGQENLDAPPSTEGRRLKLINLVFELRAFIALAVIVIVFASMSDAFLTTTNFVIMTKHVAINALLAVGMLFVILKGGIDLSVGSIVGLTGIVAGILLQGVTVGGTVIFPPVWAIIVLTLAAGAFVGAINGVLVARFALAPFIATLGMLYMARGAALLLSNGTTYPDLAGSPETGNTGFHVLGLGTMLGIPVPIWIMIGFAAAATIVLRRTPFGRWIYAIGGNERAAELSGVPLRRVKISVYVISGVCSAMAGMIIASELTSAAPQIGATYELRAIAAVVIGGASLMGGSGTVRGALVGAFVIGFLADGLVLVGVSTFWQTFIMGAVIVLAVMLDQGQQRVQKRRAAVAAASAIEAETEGEDRERYVASPSGEAEPGSKER